MQWTFRQAVVRDAAYASILEEDRAALHLAAAAWLESAGVDPGLIARHAEAGGDKARAALLYARATRDAARAARSSTRRSTSRRAGLACGAEGTTRAALLVRRGRSSSSSAASTRRSTPRSRPRASRCPARICGARRRSSRRPALIETGRSAEGDARAAWALSPQFAAALSPSIRAKLLASRVRALAALGRPAEALRAAHAAMEAARGSGSTDALLHAREAHLAALIHVGDLAAAASLGASLVADADEAGDAVIAARARLSTGSALNQLGLFEEAQALLERALLDARSRRLRAIEGFALHNLGMSHARLGNIEEGVALERQASEIADACQISRLRFAGRLYEALFLVWRGAPGDHATAHAVARWLCEEAAHRAAALQAMASFAMARVQLARRELKAAVDAAREASRHLAGGPSRSGRRDPRHARGGPPRDRGRAGGERRARRRVLRPGRARRGPAGSPPARRVPSGERRRRAADRPRPRAPRPVAALDAAAAARGGRVCPAGRRGAVAEQGREDRRRLGAEGARRGAEQRPGSAPQREACASKDAHAEGAAAAAHEKGAPRS